MRPSPRSITNSYTPISHKKSFYFVLFKDEFSNFRIVFTVRTKDLVYDSIRKCVAQIELDTRKKIECPVGDCGSKMVSNRTKEFLIGRSIAQRLSAPRGTKSMTAQLPP